MHADLIDKNLTQQLKKMRPDSPRCIINASLKNSQEIEKTMWTTLLCYIAQTHRGCTAVCILLFDGGIPYIYTPHGTPWIGAEKWKVAFWRYCCRNPSSRGNTYIYTAPLLILHAYTGGLFPKTYFSHRLGAVPR